MPRHVSGALLSLILATVCAVPASSATLRRVGNFVSPVYVTAPPGDTERVFVVERRGTIRLIEAGRILPRPFLDIRGSVTVTDDPDDERGLLSLAFAPDYATTGRFYVYRVARRPGAPLRGKIIIEEFQNAGAAATRTDPATRRLVLAIRADRNHFGGQLAFGPDGYLWLATGDGKRRGDPDRNGQNRRTLLGKVLRIDPRPGARLAPTHNPFTGRSGSPFVWSYGLRNPYRFSFDRATGDLVIADVGQNFVEEINFAPRDAGLGRGANYGWSVLEGRYRYRRSTPLNLRPARPGEVPAGAVGPVLQHLHRRGGWCSIIGGYVVRDPELPELAGRYVYGDFCRSVINSALLTAAGGGDVRGTGLRIDQLVSFGEDGCGRLYAVSLAGPVYRVSASGRCAGPAPLPFAIPTPAPGADVTRPTVTAQARPGQRVSRRRGVTVQVRCDEDCTVRMTGGVTVRGASGPVRYSLRPMVRRLAGSAPATLGLGVPAAVLRDLRGAGRGRAVATVVATDAAGNRRALSLHIAINL